MEGRALIVGLALMEGFELGMILGLNDDTLVGVEEGMKVFPTLGLNVGIPVGAVGIELIEGILVKFGLNVVGLPVGFDVVGERVGSDDGFEVGLEENFKLGIEEGSKLGSNE